MSSGRGLPIYLASIEQDRVLGAIPQAWRRGGHVEVKTITSRTTARATTTTTAAAARGARASSSSSRAVDDQTIGALGLALHLILRWCH